MEYNFKRFTKTKLSFVPKVTIRKGGYLGISQGVASRYGIDGPGYFAVFFYDEDTRIIGMQITQNREEPGAVKIQWTKNKENAPLIQIGIRSLLDYYQIDYTQSISYTPEWNENHQLVIFDLNKPKKNKKQQRK